MCVCVCVSVCNYLATKVFMDKLSAMCLCVHGVCIIMYDIVCVGCWVLYHNYIAHILICTVLACLRSHFLLIQQVDLSVLQLELHINVLTL